MMQTAARCETHPSVQQGLHVVPRPTRPPVAMPTIPLIGRDHEVQELRTGCVFKVTFGRSVLEGEAKASGLGRGLREAEVERAVCLAVEEALLSEPEKEPGVTYEIAVGSQEIETAAGMSS